MELAHPLIGDMVRNKMGPLMDIWNGYSATDERRESVALQSPI